MKDLRARYYYYIKIESELVFEGYLLHEEGWSCLSLGNNVSCTFLNNKTSKETDKRFKDFFKSLSSQ